MQYYTTRKKAGGQYSNFSNQVIELTYDPGYVDSLFEEPERENSILVEFGVEPDGFTSTSEELERRASETLKTEEIGVLDDSGVELAVCASTSADVERRALELLKKFWGHDKFRGTQLEIVSHVVRGENALVLMPTGGGMPCFF